MRPLTQVTGPAAILDRENVDTDQIIPKQFLKRIERSGFGEFLFFDWMRDPDFELRRPEAEGATILIAGRELRLRLVARARAVGARGLRLPRHPRAVLRRHLPHELRQDGPRADRGRRRRPRAGADGGASRPRADRRPRDADDPPSRAASSSKFAFDAFEQNLLVNGLDDVALTLAKADRIDAYEARTPAATTAESSPPRLAATRPGTVPSPDAGLPPQNEQGRTCGARHRRFEPPRACAESEYH